MGVCWNVWFSFLISWVQCKLAFTLNWNFRDKSLFLLSITRPAPQQPSSGVYVVVGCFRAVFLPLSCTTFFCIDIIYLDLPEWLSLYSFLILSSQAFYLKSFALCQRLPGRMVLAWKWIHIILIIAKYFCLVLLSVQKNFHSISL